MAGVNSADVDDSAASENSYMEVVEGPAALLEENECDICGAFIHTAAQIQT